MKPDWSKLLEPKKGSETELDRMRRTLHEKEIHPDWEYATLPHPYVPDGIGWQRNTDKDSDGFSFFKLHVDAYWRRRKLR